MFEDDIERARRAIQALPPVDEDSWPFLPREAFTLCEAAGGLLAYKGQFVVHFGMCVKEIENEWDEWLAKFEEFFKSAGATEAFVALDCVTCRSGESDGRHLYSWRRRWQREARGEWEFEGGPRSFI